jgi:benzaldehyde dehydrogenase (NAD)
VLRRAGQLFLDHSEELSDWIVRESGGIGPKAGLEIQTAGEECFEAAALASHPTGEILQSALPRLSFSRRVPAGVVGVIAPFNFPLILSIRSVAPALALGNAVILKPDPRTAVSGGVLLARIFEEAGLAQGLLSVLPGGGDVGGRPTRARHCVYRFYQGRSTGGLLGRPTPEARALGTGRQLGTHCHGRR